MLLTMHWRFTWYLFSFLAISIPKIAADEPPTIGKIRLAITRALPPINDAARISAEKKRCFTCHNQGLPILVMIKARDRGFEIDKGNLSRQVKHTTSHLQRGKSNYLAGIGQGGKADTAGSALWALDTAAHARNELTDAVVEFLLQRNSDTPYWTAQSKRPPSEGSRFTSSFYALRGLLSYGSEQKRPAIDQRRRQALQWLIDTNPHDNEDRVFRLRALALVKADPAKLQTAADKLLDRQREDGSWSQLDDGEHGDVYATASALDALHVCDRIGPEDVSYLRGLGYLLGTQKDDGTWHVISRSRPVQEPYESGFSHGDDQFISATASAWATLALLNAIPVAVDNRVASSRR